MSDPEVDEQVVIEEPMAPSKPISGEPGPQVGDKYTDGIKTVTVTAVGTKKALATDDADPAIEEAYPLIPAAEGGTFTPVIPPLIVFEDTTLYEYHIKGAERGLWSNAKIASATGRAIVLHPDGTWEEIVTP